ncbi:fimbrillin family protein [Prevotella sp.]
MKKTMKRHSFISRLASLAVVCGLTLAFASCANDDLAQNGKTTTDDKGLTAFSTGEPATRTTMESDGKFYWEAGDKIWVKDDSGNWKQSSNSPAGKTASFKFLMPGKYTAKSSYEVYYPGKNGNQDRVTISANQTQTEPNTTAHFGASGDCGIAKATRNATSHEFEFTLDHKAAYLVFKPYTSNDVLKYCYLTKIEVTSDNDITDTYTLDPTAETNTGALTGTGNGKKIELATIGSGAYANGFPLTNTSASLTTNGAYMVIKPGTHTLRIRYWVKDVATHVEGTITKIIPSHTFAKNEYVNMEADLQIKNYDGDKYYMWDAQEQYWKGHEWNLGGSQPTLTTQSGSSDYPKNSSDTNNRWYNTSYPGYGVSNPATHTSCKDLPNVNEMTWYAAKGEPRWDGDELWTTMGHLYKRGMWVKKKSQISGFNPNYAVDGNDWRVNRGGNSWSVSQTLPDAADANNYFYLPALGEYASGYLYGVGEEGIYWSSSADPRDSDSAYYLEFHGSSVRVVRYSGRPYGFRAEALFE